MTKRKAEGIEHTPHELEIIAKADRYVAYLFAGRGNKHKVACSTLSEAKQAALCLAAAHNRAALIYAIANNSSALVATVQP
jgi:hypothetical protein